ncbi:MAG: hypothetical protein JW828_14685 [Sedimentisphaerales bacterium]|nr:hypothetical protein [Sedimentisphaerales bacterium]
MKNRIATWSAAAALLIGIATVILFRNTTSGAVWGRLVDRVANSKTVVYRMTATIKEMPGTPEEAVTDILRYAKLAYDQGIRVDTHSKLPNKTVSTHTYVQFDEPLITMVMPEDREYITMPLTNEFMKKMERENGDPRFLLTKMMEFDYTPLGKKIFNNIQVEGIEVTNTKMGLALSPGLGEGMFDEVTARLWVSVETELPAQLAIHVSADDGSLTMDTTIDSFQWNVPISSDEMVPRIPESYKRISRSEYFAGREGRIIIDVLALFAKMTDGQYPSSLTTQTIAKEFLQAVSLKSDGSSLPPDEEMVNTLLQFQKVERLFSDMINENKDPAYYGGKVSARFPHAVLLRWKSRNDLYTVVFGDLSVLQVTPQELEEFESTSHNPDK